MWFEFLGDQDAYLNMSNNFMLGNGLKVSIQSDSNNDETSYYFPNDTMAYHDTWWCNMLNVTKESCFKGKT